MIKYSAILLSLSLLIFISCEQSLKTLGKESVSIEISLDKPRFPSQNALEKYQNELLINYRRQMNNHFMDTSYGAPPTRYAGNYIYLKSNAQDKKIIKINVNGGNALLLSNKNHKINILRYFEEKSIKDNKIFFRKENLKSTHKNYKFDYIQDFYPAENGDFYVMNHSFPQIPFQTEEELEKAKISEKKQKNIKKDNNNKDLTKNIKPPVIAQNPLVNPQTPHNKNNNLYNQTPPIAQNIPVNPPKPVVKNNPQNVKQEKFLLKFDKNGNFLYKIGKTGKNGLPFDLDKGLHLIYCDKNNYLYLIFKSYNDKSPSLFKESYELFRITPQGNIDIHENDILKWVPAEKGFVFNLSEIQITPASQKLLFHIKYYPTTKSNNSKERGFNPTLSKLIFIDLQNKSYKSDVIRELKNEELKYSLLGVNDQDETYLNIPLPESKNTLQHKLYNIQVLTPSGRNKEIKSLLLENNPEDTWHWFSVGLNGELVVFTKRSQKMIFNYYR